MPSIYSALRYTVFGLLIACNAITASVTVWNFSFAQAAQVSFPVEPYLIFVGLSGLVATFVLVFVELVRRNAVTVWVESLWSGIFLVMSLIGASVLSSTVPSAMCSKKVVKHFKGSCVSTQVILAFSWISTIILFAYFLLVIVTACLRHRDNPRIWRCSIHNLHSLDCYLGSTPTTPILPRFIGTRATAPTIVQPKPFRPVPDLMYAYRSGLSPDYEIEHFRLPQPPPAAAEPGRSTYPASSFYSQAVQSVFNSQSQAPPVQRVLPQLSLPPTPPPLGEWPRADIMRQPSSSKVETRDRARRPPLPNIPDPPTSPTRPGGPRKRSKSGSGMRPPPLDLSKLSTFNRAS